MKNMDKMTGKVHFLSLVQFLVILAPFVFFFDAAVIFRGRINLSVSAVIIALCVLNGALLLLSVLTAVPLYRFLKDSNKRTEFRLLRSKRLFSYIPLTAVGIAFFVLALLQFDTIPRYDGGLYYDVLMTATETFTFSMGSFLSSFSFFTHPTQGMSLLAATGEMLFPKQSTGVYGVTVIVTLAAMYCLYRIMGRIFPDKAPWLKAAGTAVFAFCPYVLGLYTHLSPDYYVLMFFVILVFAFAEDLEYLAAFMSLLMVFTKETGILFAASFLVPAILIRANKTEGKNYIVKVMKYIFPRRFFLYGAAPVLFLCYYLLFTGGPSFGEGYTSKSPIRWDSSGVHCFGFDIKYITDRLEQILYFNFFWVISALFLAGFFVFLFRKGKDQSVNLIDDSADLSVLAGIALSSLVYTIFSCLFITIICPRYNVIFALPISLVSVWAVSRIWKRQIFVKIVMSGLILLFLVQNYFNLDPSLSLGNRKIDLGYEYICSPTGQHSFMSLDYVNEMYVYNQTYAYTEGLLDKAMEQINPDSDDHFLVIGTDWYELYLIGDVQQTTHLIYWDPVNQKRTYDKNAAGAFLPKLSAVPGTEILSNTAPDLADDFYFLMPARLDEDAYCTALENSGYTAADSFVVKNNIGFLSVYHFVKTDS